MLIEMRRYSILPGRMDAMHERMSRLLIPLFEEHGMPRPFAIWEDRNGSSILTWLIGWPSFDERQAAWARVVPAFAAARAKQQGEEFVTRTALTLIAPFPGHVFELDKAPSRACETAWHVQPRIGRGAAFAAACESSIFPRLRELGGVAITACNYLFGALPQVAIFVTWPDAETRQVAEEAVRAEEAPGEVSKALLGAGTSFGSSGDWESLDRATYLVEWDSSQALNSRAGA